MSEWTPVGGRYSEDRSLESRVTKTSWRVTSFIPLVVCTGMVAQAQKVNAQPYSPYAGRSYWRIRVVRRLEGSRLRCVAVRAQMDHWTIESGASAK
jgi:hypothetical protein